MALNTGGEAIALIQHCAAEGPGQITAWAETRGHRLDIYRSDLNQRPPWSNYRACILLGGPWSASQAASLAWLDELCQELSQQRGQIGFFGICLGAQLLAQALGAEVGPTEANEAGWCVIQENGQNNAKQKRENPQKLWVLQWREEGFSLPPRALPWAHSLVWPNQAFAWPAQYGNIASQAEATIASAIDSSVGLAPIIGLQFHPEWQAEQIAQFIAEELASPFSAVDLIHQQRFQQMHQWLERQLDAWLNITIANTPSKQTTALGNHTNTRGPQTPTTSPAKALNQSENR